MTVICPTALATRIRRCGLDPFLVRFEILWSRHWVLSCCEVAFHEFALVSLGILSTCQCLINSYTPLAPTVDDRNPALPMITDIP